MLFGRQHRQKKGALKFRVCFVFTIIINFKWVLYDWCRNKTKQNKNVLDKIDLKALPAGLRALPHYFAVRGISKLVYVSTLAKMLNPHFFRTGIRGHVPSHMSRFPGIEAMTWLANYPITCSSTHSKRSSSRPPLMLTMLCRRMWRKIPSRSCTMSQSWLRFTVGSLQFFITIVSLDSIGIEEVLASRMQDEKV